MTLFARSHLGEGSLYVFWLLKCLSPRCFNVGLLSRSPHLFRVSYVNFSSLLTIFPGLVTTNDWLPLGI